MASNSSIGVKCEFKIESIEGKGNLENINIIDTSSNEKSSLDVDGSLLRIGIDPKCDYFNGNLKGLPRLMA
ncbi:hypothetical protein ACFLWU_01815 [Chloroflexota bacterium]